MSMLVAKVFALGDSINRNTTNHDAVNLHFSVVGASIGMPFDW